MDQLRSDIWCAAFVRRHNDLGQFCVVAQKGDPVAGQTIYANKCASCHGANGEGVEGKGKGVAGWTMTAAEFEDILRTGGKGKLGNEHLFGPLQISPSGMENLYVFVQTLLKK